MPYVSKNLTPGEVRAAAVAETKAAAQATDQAADAVCTGIDTDILLSLNFIFRSRLKRRRRLQNSWRT